jgi:hypothetical protein
MARYYYRLTGADSDMCPCPGVVVSDSDWVEADNEDEALELIADQQAWEYESHGPTDFEITRVEANRR